ncbi:hypothetical protein, partial [Pseudomonas lopnurensis]|uniref:hypothetical protein n=1 Tax=Pseudomonas lopnurensis TaxID=1477517 RepID=UPI0028AAA69B
CKLQAASCKLQASVGWMSLFTSTVAPLVGSMKRDPNYELEAGSWKLEASVRTDTKVSSSAFRFLLPASGFQLQAAFLAFT